MESSQHRAGSLFSGLFGRFAHLLRRAPWRDDRVPAHLPSGEPGQAGLSALDSTTGQGPGAPAQTKSVPASGLASSAAKRRARAPRRAGGSPRKVINLALQGGGAHAAFTWGILDRLLEEERIVIEGVSGASAGAINAALLAHGAIDGGAEGARALLDRFWRQLAALSHFSPVRATPMERMAPGWNADWSAGQMLFDLVTRVFSPYQINPFALNPLRDLLEELIDFERLRSQSPVRLFVSATNVHTGKVRVFRTEELSADVLLASACLPSLHQAVKIDEDHYWDGGFTSNPAILPLVSEGSSADIVLVQVTPFHHSEVPVTAQDIRSRLNHIVFNAPLIREIQSIAWMQDAVKDVDVAHGSLAHRLRHIRIHHIDAGDALAPLGASSALNPEWEFVADLRDLGRARADDWLARNFERLGIESTADLAAKFL